VGLTGATGPTGPQGPSGSGLIANVYDNTEFGPEFVGLLIGSTATAATKIDHGIYQVTFDRDVSNCAAVATVTTGGATANTQAGTPDSTQVTVYLVNFQGGTFNYISQDFYLVVVCP
jgi:hypothetical protein